MADIVHNELWEVQKLLSPFHILNFAFTFYFKPAFTLFDFHILLIHITSIFHFKFHIFHFWGQAFKLFDADGDGLITTTELRSLIKKVVQKITL